MKRLIVGLLTCCGLMSCVSLQYMTVDSLIPADVSLPSSIRKIGVVNNALPMSVKDHQAVTLYDVLPGDAALLTTTLAEAIANTEYFDEVRLSDSLLRGEGASRREDIIPESEITQLMDDLGVDLLLSVDQLTFESSHTMLEDDSSDRPIDGLKINIQLLTRLYLQDRSVPFRQFVDTDSLYLPLDETTDRELATFVAEFASILPLGHFIPQWQEENRYYYVSGTYEMRDANVAIREDDWELAYRLWKKVYDRKSKGKTHMRTAYNLAFYYEMQGDFEKAFQYIDEAMRLAVPKGKEGDTSVRYKMSGDWNLIAKYREKLQEKMVQQQKLDIQMERFEVEN